MITDIHITDKNWKKMIINYSIKNKRKICTKKELTHIISWLKVYADGFTYPNVDKIGLNLYNILNHRNKDLNFYQRVCSTISHEIIHIVLERTIDKTTSKMYDNIYRKLELEGYMA